MTGHKPAPRVRQVGGFTLVEVLVVVVILGILATLAIPRYMDSRAHAFRTAAVSDLRNLSSHQELHFRDGTGYAGDLEALELLPTRGVELVITAVAENGWAARATPTRLPGVACGLYYGGVDPEAGAPADRPGVIRCTTP